MAEKIRKGKEIRKNIRYSLPVSRPIDRIPTDGKFIQSESMDAASSKQSHTQNPLRETLIEAGVLDRTENLNPLMVRRDFLTVEDAINAAAGVRLMLGELLLAASSITHDQLENALREQKKTGEKIGEVLVRLGLFSQTEIDMALAFQSRQEKGGTSLLSLGELLISTGYITHDHLQDALDRQKKSNKKLGEILVEAGHCQPHHIEHVLHIQKQLVAAALMVAMSLAPLNEAVASSPVAMSTKIQVTATVLARASMHILRQPAEIIVTDADIKRGFLDMNAASLVEIKNNSRAGVNLIFDVHGLPFKETLISGFGREVSLGPNGGSITHQIIGTNIVAFSYRFIFDENSRAGTYAWPLFLSVSPLE
ncbi:MAG: hypothetical protein WC373_09865 [Smithella sp.]